MVAMRYTAYRTGLPSNPLVRIAFFIVAVIMLIGAVFLGAVVLSLIVGLGALAWLVISVRLWWMRRQFRSRRSDSNVEQSKPGEIIGVEYTVIEERSENPNSNEDTR